MDDHYIVCTPTGISKGFLTPEMICLVDIRGNHLEKNSACRPASEVLIHLEIYRNRSDIKAVIHSHPVHATAFALVGMPIPEGIHPEAELFMGRVPMANFAMPSKFELAESIMPLIQNDTHAIIMSNHGVVCFSDTLEHAYYRLEILDSYCHMLLLTRNLGRPNQFNNEQMMELLEDHRLKKIMAGNKGEQSEKFLRIFDSEENKLDDEVLDSLADRVADKILKRLEERKRIAGDAKLPSRASGSGEIPVAEILEASFHDLLLPLPSRASGSNITKKEGLVLPVLFGEVKHGVQVF